MIIDVHTHIFPDEIRKNRGKYFSDEPAFKKLYQSPKSRLIGAHGKIQSFLNGTTITSMRWSAVTRTVLSVWAVLIPSVMERRKKPGDVYKKAGYPESGNWHFTHPELKIPLWADWSLSWKFAGIEIYPF
jgi:heme exporter protein D